MDKARLKHCRIKLMGALWALILVGDPIEIMTYILVTLTCRKRRLQNAWYAAVITEWSAAEWSGTVITEWSLAVRHRRQ